MFSKSNYQSTSCVQSLTHTGVFSPGIEAGDQGGRKVRSLETNTTMEIAQLLLSLLHAWGMDPDLDRVCEGKLGLLRPMVPVSFGVLSKGGKTLITYF
jgi:hypothetical protein